MSIDEDFEYLRLGHVTNGKRRCVADGFAWPCQTMRSLDRIEARESQLREALERIAWEFEEPIADSPDVVRNIARQALADTDQSGVRG